MSVGLDIGSETIKVVEITKDGKINKLSGSGIIKFAGNAVQTIIGEIGKEKVSESIKKLHNEAGISIKEVGIALPESMVFTRTIKFPYLTDQEIASAVKWEAEQYIPIPVADAIISHSILERKETGVSPGVSVLLVASPKDLVEKYISVVGEAGLTVAFVETDLIALSRVFAPQDKVILVVDLGASSSDIAIVNRGQLAFSHSIPVAGTTFTRAISKGVGIETAQAEEYKKTYGASKAQLEGKIKTVLDPVFRIVVDEIKKAIHFYQSEEKGEAPASIVLSGGSSVMPEIASTLTTLLGLEVVVGNPFTNITLDNEAAKTMSAYTPLYSIAVGLALREQL